MKTIKEVLETLEEPYRSQALANLDLTFDPKGWEKSDKNQSDAVFYAFNWSNTKESPLYWNDFYGELLSKGL